MHSWPIFATEVSINTNFNSTFHYNTLLNPFTIYNVNMTTWKMHLLSIRNCRLRWSHGCRLEFLHCDCNLCRKPQKQRLDSTIQITLGSCKDLIQNGYSCSLLIQAEPVYQRQHTLLTFIVSKLQNRAFFFNYYTTTWDGGGFVRSPT